MAVTAEQVGIRKSLLVTASVAVVFAASDATNVNWIISLSGVWAWLFIAVVHGYFSLMWFIHRQMFEPNKATHRQHFMVKNGITPKQAGNGVDYYFGGRYDGSVIRQLMARRFTDWVAVIGTLAILYGSANLAWKLTHPPTPGAHQSTYPHRWPVGHEDRSQAP